MRGGGQSSGLSRIALRGRRRIPSLRRSGGMETYQQLLGTMDAMEMVIVTSDYWGAVHGADPGEVQGDIEGMEVAAKLGRNMAWMVKVLAESKVPVPETHPRTMTNFIR